MLDLLRILEREYNQIPWLVKKESEREKFIIENSVTSLLFTSVFTNRYKNP